MQQCPSIRYLHEGKPGWLMTAREAVQLISDEDAVALRFATNGYIDHCSKFFSFYNEKPLEVHLRASFLVGRARLVMPKMRFELSTLGRSLSQ